MLDAQPPPNGSARSPGSRTWEGARSVDESSPLIEYFEAFFDNAAGLAILTVEVCVPHRERAGDAKQLYGDGRISTLEGHKDPRRANVPVRETRLLG